MGGVRRWRGGWCSGLIEDKVGWVGLGWGYGGRRKWVDFVCIWKIELIEFSEELDVGCEEELRMIVRFIVCVVGMLEVLLIEMLMIVG